jgi:hypothetical protein
LTFSPLWRAFTGSFAASPYADISSFINGLIVTRPDLPWPDLLKPRGIQVQGRPQRVVNTAFLPLRLGERLRGSVDSLPKRQNGPQTNAATAASFYTFRIVKPGFYRVRLDIEKLSRRMPALEVIVREAATFRRVGWGAKPFTTAQEVSLSFDAGSYVVEIRSWALSADRLRPLINAGTYTLVVDAVP